MSKIESPSISDLTVVVLSYNRREELERNIPKLVDLLGDGGIELIVVDNGSSDGSAEYLREVLDKHPALVLVPRETNRGVAEGRNEGWKKASRDFILNIDDDLWIDEDAILKLLQAMGNHPEVGILSPRIVQAKSGMGQCDYGEKDCEISNFHGACHMVRAVLLEQVGLIDELCRFGGEELDYSIRSRVKGWRVIYSPIVTVQHNNKSRAGTEGRFRRENWLFNFTRVFHKHFPVGRAAALSFRYGVSAIISGTREFGVTFGIKLIAAIVRGVRDGRKHRELVPDEVIRFYSSRDLRPEFGNVPLTRKLLRRVLG
jgi:GT2 family glycosyltransferase